MRWAYLQQYSLIACNLLGTGTESVRVVIVSSPELLLIFTVTMSPNALRYDRSEPGDGMAAKLLRAYLCPAFGGEWYAYREKRPNKQRSPLADR